jgi:outer membrane protein
MRYSFFLFLSFFLSTARLVAQNNESIRATQNASSPDVIGSTLALPQAVAIAIKNNLVVNQADLNSQSYKISFDQSWEYMLPTLSASGGQQINFGRTISSVNNQYITSEYSSGSLSANAGLVIFHGLQYQNGVKQYRYAWDASKMDLQNQKDNITLNVLLAYLQVLSSTDQLNLAREQATVDSVTLVRLNEQNKEGALNPVSTLTDLQGQYAGDQATIAAAVNTLEQNKVLLFGVLNVPYNRDVAYQNSVTATDISEYQASSDSIFQHALQILPSIKSAQLKVYEYQKALAAARGGYWPTVSFGAGVNTNWTNSPQGTFVQTGTQYDASQTQFLDPNGATPIYNKEALGYTVSPKFGDQFKNNRGENIGLSVSIPILNGFQIRNNVRNAKLNLKNYEILNTNARYVLQQNVEAASQNMIAAYKQYKLYKEQTVAFEESFRITNIRFTEGVIASDAYILAKGRNDQAEINLALAKYTYIFRTKVLDYYQGRLNLNQ